MGVPGLVPIPTTGRIFRSSRRIRLSDRAEDGRLRLEFSTKLELPEPPSGGGTTWTFRLTDIDLLGHVNNAAYWDPIEELLSTQGPDPRRPSAHASNIAIRSTWRTRSRWYATSTTTGWRSRSLLEEVRELKPWSSGPSVVDLSTEPQLAFPPGCRLFHGRRLERLPLTRVYTRSSRGLTPNSAWSAFV